MFGEDVYTLGDLVSRYEGGYEVLNAAREVDKILRESATATVGFGYVDSASELEDQYFTRSDGFDIPHIRFEDSIKKLRAKSEVSWIFGVKKSPTNVKTPSAYFRIYFGVPEEDARPIKSDELANLQLQLPPSLK